MNITLAIITKNEEDNIPKLFKNTRDYVDQIVMVDTGSSDSTIKTAKKYSNDTPLIIEEGDFTDEVLGVFNFAEARHRSFQLAEENDADWILWLDADDTVDGIENIGMVVEKAEQEGWNGVYLPYHYTFDEHGNLTSGHFKERLLKANEWEWEWEYKEKRGIRYPIHENLYPYEEKQCGLMHEPKVIHGATDEDHEASALRNLQILRKLEAWERESDLGVDPRTVFLLGRQLHTLKSFEEAKRLLHEYLTLNPNPGDEKLVYQMLAEYHLERGEWNASRQYAYTMLSRFPEEQLSWALVAQYHMYIGDYRIAALYAQNSREVGDKYEGVHTGTYMPKAAIQKQTLVLAESLANSGDQNYNADDIRVAVQELSNYMQYVEKENKEHFSSELNKYKSMYAMHKHLDAFEKLLDDKLLYVEKEKGVEVWEEMYALLPENVKRAQPARLLKMKRAFGDYVKQESPHINFYCPGVFETFTPASLMEKGGGGSETAVVELAKRFRDRGYKVTVYAAPDKEQEYDGVMYKKHENIDWSTHFDIFVSWRTPTPFERNKVLANKKYIWLQDIMSPSEYRKEVVDRVDKIIVLSKYHRWYLPGVSDDKMYISKNGINVELIEEAEKEAEPRNPKKIIYASSFDRGLEELIYQIFPKVQREVPDAELYWFYGWDAYRALNKKHGVGSEEVEKNIKKFEEQMRKLGVHIMGRVGKKELYKQMFSAGVWAYPLKGPQETSCIVAMEAQATGMFPITTGTTALNETQQFGIKAENIENYTEALTRFLQGDYPEGIDDESALEDYRSKMIQWARDTYNWDTVADSWAEDLFYGL